MNTDEEGIRRIAPVRRRGGLLAMSLLSCGVGLSAAELATEDGYRGIWYFNEPLQNEYKFKYSGGFATYPQQHIPIAIYARAANKTFFVYGGTTARKAEDRQELLHMISWFDHETGSVPRPRVLLNKKTEDAHDNPVLSIDDAGHLWVFSAAHGTSRPAYIHRSDKPYAIESFTQIAVTNFSYPQPWHVPGQGFLFLHTRYGANRGMGVGGQRNLFSMTSRDGVNWENLRPLAGIEHGDYQISWLHGRTLGTAFDFHPPPLGLNARANIYYLATDDFGETWRSAAGRALALPITAEANPALAYDSRKDGQLVYLKDLNCDAEGRPVILFLTSNGYASGPENDPRIWRTVHWDGSRWNESRITTSDNNYDHGSLYIEGDRWRVIAPTATGPQPFNPGGEMEMWVSDDRGAHWRRLKQLTKDSPFNHTYARRPLNAQPDFYAFWADGHGRQPSMSALYFTDREGTGVWRLPVQMTAGQAKAEKVH
ncbi:MAG TPA: hypothetical protein DCY13_13715 [Verrucomicrobiales bacterium]|nr:hypothetical protein [Verrucomicrobiales bacterium]